MNLRCLNKNKTPNHYKLIVTTSWDDGSKSDIRINQLLNKYSIKSTFYVTKSYQYLERPLTAPEIIELDQKHEIGAHTLTHPDLDKLDYEKANNEILGSKEYLESLLDHDVRMFSYPRNRYNPEIIEIVKNAGFIGARTCNQGDCNNIHNPYTWQITLPALNGSPIVTLQTWKYYHLSLKSLIDWEIRAKEVFDLALNKGGVYHICGHASEIEKYNEWNKLENVLFYISNRDNVQYMTNGEVLEKLSKT